MTKVAVIDIGSNSVRLMTKDKKVQKFVKMTQLGKGLHETKMLSKDAMKSSIQAVQEFLDIAKDYKTYCFATEAVRSAKNGKEFCAELQAKTGIYVDVLTPSEEALAGFLGAGGKNSEITVLDVGGASTEIITGKNGKIEYSVSLPIGAVRLFDRCGEDIEKLCRVVSELIPKDLICCDNWVAIGGTVTTIGAMKYCPTGYDKEKIHQKELSISDVERAIDELLPLSESERSEKYPVIAPKRARVMVSGASIIKTVMTSQGISKITLSDSDNAEGYLLLRNYED